MMTIKICLAIDLSLDLALDAIDASFNFYSYLSWFWQQQKKRHTFPKNAHATEPNT